MASVLWQIWKARNGFIFRRQRLDAMQVVDEALTTARVACLSQCRSSGTGTRAAIGQLQINLGELWRPPDPGCIKVNIDGAFQSNSKTGTMACICRDQNGMLVDGLTRDFDASTALQAEFMALTITLYHLLDTGRQRDPPIIKSTASF
ncbi:uncharacterized protein LOC120291894 [Eucalyptus grandis]|uniref:uncharacterized protein LOC120291894 n=1 Tax=Eucalyptus grandis TaxID=71139 RepID=UPI00192EDC60|nr:uncharacterized protein LOC120291894 [Eucalyptus grandis]